MPSFTEYAVHFVLIRPDAFIALNIYLNIKLHKEANYLPIK